LIDLDQNPAYILDTKLLPGTQLKRERITEIKTVHLEQTRASEELGDYQEIEVTTIRKNIYVHKKCFICHHMMAYKTCDFCEKTENQSWYIALKNLAIISAKLKVCLTFFMKGMDFKSNFG
jgi:hypothetical protein